MNDSLETIIDIKGTEDEKNAYHFALDGTTWALIKQHHSDIIPQVSLQHDQFYRVIHETKMAAANVFDCVETSFPMRCPMN